MVFCAKADKIIQKFVEDFETYIRDKEKDALSLKYENKGLRPDYVFLTSKLKAIEKAITRELGRAALKEIKDSYTQEMLKRIIEERINKI